MSSLNRKYYYKASSLDATDERERELFELNNDFGYNLGSEKRKEIDYERVVSTLKNKYNYKIFNEKK